MDVDLEEIPHLLGQFTRAEGVATGQAAHQHDIARPGADLGDHDRIFTCVTDDQIPDGLSLGGLGGAQAYELGLYSRGG